MADNAQENKNSFFQKGRVTILLADAKGNPSNTIQADSMGNLPDTIEVMPVGNWETPYHGELNITEADLYEYITNFKKGIARASNGELGLPINFAHESWEKAAGWMKDLFIEGDRLMASVEWTDAGKQALLSGEWKCISPEFCPRGRGGWNDPMNKETFVENVLEGAALTNIPLFRNMKPVMASASNGGNGIDQSNVFILKASEIKEKNMQLEDVVKKDNSELTEDEKNFLAENKANLTDEQKTKFGFEVVKDSQDNAGQEDNKKEEEQKEVPTTEENKELAGVSASVVKGLKEGTHVVVEASRLERLEKTATDYEEKEASTFVLAHVARGAIKADQASNWAKRIMADATLKQDLEALPSNEAIASEAKGSDENAGDATAPVADRVEKEAQKLIASAKESGETLSLSEAYSKVLASNQELADQYNQQNIG